MFHLASLAHTGLVDACDIPRREDRSVTQRPTTRLTGEVDRYVRRHFGTDADRAIAELSETVPRLPLSSRQDPERLAMAIVLLADQLRGPSSTRP